MLKLAIHFEFVFLEELVSCRHFVKTGGIRLKNGLCCKKTVKDFESIRIIRSQLKSSESRWEY